jgi:ABC-2 type transport system ATP-binding protein
MTGAGGWFAGITKRYSRWSAWVLKGIDLELQPGSRTVIVGGNGSGKSTLLRIGAGVTLPNGGVVRLPDRIGYVPERLAARIRFTGSEYLAHMGRIKGLSSEVVRDRSSEILQRLDLQPGPDEPIDSLSKGNRQKLVLAQAFLAPTGLLILDEPFSGLDAVAHAALNELTHEAQSSGTAVLLSSHRPFRPHAGLRQLRIEGGQLAELRIDDSIPETQESGMEVQLRATATSSDPRQLSSIPGVSAVRHGVSPHLVVLMTDQVRIDRVLLDAIAQGWSVRAVRPVSGDGSQQ